MELDRPSFVVLEKEKAARRRDIKILSKTLSFIDMEEVSGLRNLLMEHGPLLSKFVHKQWPDFGNETAPTEWNKHINPGENLLHFATRKGNTTSVELLLAFGSDVNCCSFSPWKSTPLHHAALLGDGTLIDVVLEFGAHCKAKNEDGENAFLIACKRGKKEIVFKIMTMGEGANGIIDDYNARNSLGQSALWLACYNGLLEVVVELLKVDGVSLMEKEDNEGRSLLHAACINNQVDVATFLINNGSSPASKGFYPDAYGKLPFEYITAEEARMRLHIAHEQFKSGGGHSGLRVRRKEAEERLRGKRFNWMEELKSVDPRKGIHSTKADSDVFVVHASKHQKTKFDKLIERGALDDDSYEQEVHDIYAPVLSPSESENTSRVSANDLSPVGEVGAEESKGADLSVTGSIDLTERLDGAFSGKEERTAELREAAAYQPYDPLLVGSMSLSMSISALLEEGSEEEAILLTEQQIQEMKQAEEREKRMIETSGIDFVPSIHDFLVKYCDFSEERAMKCARISKMRNILHLNKLYVILQALESMDQTNFSFKDIGVFYSDEVKLRDALKWYYRSGAMTSLGITIEGDSGYENEFARKQRELKKKQKHHKVELETDDDNLKSAKAEDAKIVNASNFALMYVCRTRKPKLGRHRVIQKFQPEEKARLAEEGAAERLKYLFH